MKCIRCGFEPTKTKICITCKYHLEEIEKIWKKLIRKWGRE